MNLAKMRTRTEEILGLVGAFDVNDLDEQLNMLWQREVPNRFGGAITQGHVDWSTVSSQADYDIETLATADGGKVLKGFYAPVIDLAFTRILRFTDQPAKFWDWNDTSPVTSGRPLYVLLQDTTMTIRPIPDQVYTMRFYAGLYRAALTSDGLADDVEAMVCVSGAARNIALFNGRDGPAQRAQVMFEYYVGVLAPKYIGRSQSAMGQDEFPTQDAYPAGGF